MVKRTVTGDIPRSTVEQQFRKRVQKWLEAFGVIDKDTARCLLTWNPKKDDWKMRVVISKLHVYEILRATDWCVAKCFCVFFYHYFIIQDWQVMILFDPLCFQPWANSLESSELVDGGFCQVCRAEVDWVDVFIWEALEADYLFTPWN